MIEILCYGLGIILMVVLYVAINQTIKLSKLQVKYDEDFTEYETYTYNVYFFIYSILIELTKTMKDIDNRGIFEKDDEVGIAFTAIQEAIEQVRYELSKLSSDVDDKTQENPNVEKNVFHVSSRRRDNTVQSKRKPTPKGSDLYQKNPSRPK